MPLPPPAEPGMSLADVDTPALVIDLDAFERNLRRMADTVAKHGVRLRPHGKTHKSPHIALRQMEHGAIGVCCQKVSEAEVMVDGGVTDVLVSNEVIGRRKLDRLAALAERAKVALCVDDSLGIREAAGSARDRGVVLDTLVEINVGGNRCGVEPGGPAVALAQEIANSPHLRFAGLQAYYGRAQHMREHAERREAIAHAVACVRRTVEPLAKLGLACDIIGGAGTGTFEMEAASGVYNELQAGSYIFMDADYARNHRADGGPFNAFEHALFVYVTVMSAPVDERAVVDAGHKALSNDSGMAEPFQLAGALYQRPSDEHGLLDLTACNNRPNLGDKLLLVPGHCDPTVNLHDWYIGVRGLGGPSPVVEVVWPVAARGAVF